MNSKMNKNSKMIGFINALNILIGQVNNAQDKRNFKNELDEAIRENDCEKLENMICNIVNYIDEKTKDGTIKEKTYESPPSFDEATRDLISLLCSDVANVPDLPEFFAEVDKTVFEAVFGREGDGAGARRGRRNQPTHRVADTVNTLIKKGMIVVSADCQSGKTNFTICSAVKGMLDGKSAVIVVRNLNGDANQMNANIDSFNAKLEAYLIKHGVVERRFGVSFIKGNKLTNPNTREEVKSSLNGGYPRIVVCLGNNTQLTSITEIAKETNGSFNLYIDEIDKVDYGNVGEDNDTVFDILAELKKQAYQVFGITATPLDCIFSESELTSVNQVRLSPPSDYRGFCDIQVKPLEIDPNTAALNRIATYDQICEADANLVPFLTKFSNSRPDFSCKNGQYVPNICLIKNTRFNENQKNLFDGILENFGSKFVVVTYNGFGVSVSHPDIPENFTINGVTGNRGEFFKVDIANVLQYLKDNGGVEKFPRIIIIAGELAGRCISYVSRDYVWHLTDMYYNPAATTSIPEMIQSAGRLCGRNRGKSHLHLYVTLKVADALYNGFHFTNEAVTRAIASPLLNDEGQEQNFADSIKSIPMLNKKMPLKRKLTNKVKVLNKEFNLVKKDDGGKNLDSYKYELVEENKTSGEGAGVEESKSEEFTREIPEEEFIRLTTKMFPKWSKADTNIARFMKNLDPRKIYTETEMMELVLETGIIRIILVQKLVFKNSKGMGIIVRKNIDNTYQLQPVLVEAYNKYF